MDKINEAVLRHLRGQQEHREGIALWEKIWMRFRHGGADSIEKFLAELLEDPNTTDKESNQ